MDKLQVLTREEYIRIGRTIGSDLMHREAEEAISRWERDFSVLKKYGYTTARLAELRALV